jgi:NitT/TauT family transport system ATP-binding protein
MKQRVALARAFAQDADLLLMDEPFGALDAMTRDALHQELEHLWSKGTFSVVFVTHNVREAVRLGDRVVLLTSRPGRVARVFDVDIPRPRRHNTPEVGALARSITDELLEEVRAHGH